MVGNIYTKLKTRYCEMGYPDRGYEEYEMVLYKKRKSKFWQWLIGGIRIDDIQYYREYPSLKEQRWDSRFLIKNYARYFNSGRRQVIH